MLDTSETQKKSKTRDAPKVNMRAIALSIYLPIRVKSHTARVISLRATVSARGIISATVMCFGALVNLGIIPRIAAGLTRRRCSGSDSEAPGISGAIPANAGIQARPARRCGGDRQQASAIGR
jgi:hypothetical protein